MTCFKVIVRWFLKLRNKLNVVMYPLETRPKWNAYYHCDLELRVVWDKSCALNRRRDALQFANCALYYLLRGPAPSFVVGEMKV